MLVKNVHLSIPGEESRSSFAFQFIYSLSSNLPNSLNHHTLIPHVIYRQPWTCRDQEKGEISRSLQSMSDDALARMRTREVGPTLGTHLLPGLQSVPIDYGPSRHYGP